MNLKEAVQYLIPVFCWCFPLNCLASQFSGHVVVHVYNYLIQMKIYYGIPNKVLQQYEVPPHLMLLCWSNSLQQGIACTKQKAHLCVFVVFVSLVIY